MYRKQEKNNRHVFEHTLTIDSGVTRIETETNKPVFQILIGERLSHSQKKALWIDSGNNCSTYALGSAGEVDVMDRVWIGRAFTALQHFHICNRLEEFIEPETEYIVLPNIDQQYREGLGEKERNDLFSNLLSRLKALKNDKPELKILYSLYKDDSAQINLEILSLTDNTIELQETSHGMKSETNASKKKFYRDSGFVQTTVPYWTSSSKHSMEVKSYGENKLDL